MATKEIEVLQTGGYDATVEQAMAEFRTRFPGKTPVSGKIVWAGPVWSMDQKGRDVGVEISYTE